MAREKPDSNTPVVASFDIRFWRYLDESGNALRPLPDFAQDPNQLLAAYRMMVRTRTFDEKAITLQRTGKLGTYASSLGQEAVFVAIGSIMDERDVFIPYYREHGTLFMRGVTMTELLLYWGGDERGMDYAVPRQDFPVSVPIATQIPHAAGVAFAMKYRHEPRVAVSVFGDGATSKGDFYEALNLAGAWQLPLVLVVDNNQWAISVPRNEQTRCTTLAQKAIAGGFEGEQVDGNDIIAVMDRFAAAMTKAREGGGPTLIEAVTYRLSDHTTADDASRYRNEQEVKENWELEPIKRLRQYLVANSHWDEQQEQQLQRSCEQEVEESVQKYLAIQTEPAERMFDYLYETLPDALRPQRDALRQKG